MVNATTSKTNRTTKAAQTGESQACRSEQRAKEEKAQGGGGITREPGETQAFELGKKGPSELKKTKGKEGTC